MRTGTRGAMGHDMDVRGWRALVGVLVLGLWLTGCGGEEAPRGRGGKLGQLHLRMPGTPTAAGLSTSVLVAELLCKGDPDEGAPCDRWDFEGTTVEVEGPPGFTFETTRRLPKTPSSYERQHAGHVIRIGCGAEPDVSHDIRVRVMAGDVQRYEDVFTLRCHEPTGLRVEPRNTSGGGMAVTLEGRFLLGGRLTANLTLTATVNGQPDVALGGEGLRVEDAKGLLRQREASSGFDLVAAGQSPVLGYRNASVTLPLLEVVDTSAWTLALSAWSTSGLSPENPNEWRIRAQALAQDGTELKGLDGCDWRVTLARGDVEQRIGACTLSSSLRPQEACVRLGNQSVCRSYP